MNCRSAEHAMDRALDEAIPSAQMGELEAHLSRCAGCRRQWEALRAAEALLRVPRPAQAPDDLLADFRRRLEAEQPVAPRTPARPWLSWLWPTGSLAAAGLAAALALTFNLSGSFQAPPSPQPESARMARNQVPPVSSDLPSPVKPAPVVPTPTPNPAGRLPETTSRLALVPKGRRTEPQAPRGGSHSVAASETAARPRRVEPETRLDDRPAPGLMAKKQDGGLTTRANVRDGESRGLAQITPGTNGTADRLKLFGRTTEEKSAYVLDASGLASSTAKRGPQGTSSGSPQQRVAAGRRGDSADALGLRREKKPLSEGSPESGEQLARSAPDTGEASAAGESRTHARFLSLTDQSNTANFYFQDVDKLQPNELNVSPAVLTALQRPVEVTLKGNTVAGAMRQLTEAADVALSVDPRVAGVAVNVEPPGAPTPLWVVLQEVARQGNLQIIPQENRLELRPAGTDTGKPAARLSFSLSTPAPAGPSAAPSPGANSGTPPPPAMPAGLAGGQRFRAEPERPTKAFKGRPSEVRPASPKPQAPRPQARKGPADPLAADKSVHPVTRIGAAPDRRVWPDQWGRLPEWGFLLPGPEGLPTETTVDTDKAVGPAAAKPGTRPQNKAKRGERK